MPTEVASVRASRSAAAHGDGGLGTEHGVVAAGEHQQQRVPSELEEAPTLVIGHPQHPREHVVEDLGQLLGSDATLAGEAFREGGEPGDVDETARAVDRPPQGTRRLEIPFR